MVAPTQFGRFDLRRVLGRGAMGVVYAAWDPLLEREVAVKVLHAPALSSDLATERFHREAKTLARLTHPHIVTIYDIGTEAKQPFIVMELVDGYSVAEAIKAGHQFTVSDKLRLCAEACTALHYAHGVGIVHRDIKPANLLLTRDGRAKLADFGIARLHDSTMTRSSEIIGTPLYLAPELVQGVAPSPRSDVYALGATLYEWLCGAPPRVLTEPTTWVVDIATRDALDIREHWPECPIDLAFVLKQALAREPLKRTESAGALASHLRAVIQSVGAATVITRVAEGTALRVPTSIAATSRPRPRLGRAAAALILAAAATTAVGWGILHTGWPVRRGALAPALLDQQPVLTQRGPELATTASRPAQTTPLHIPQGKNEGGLVVASPLPTARGAPKRPDLTQPTDSVVVVAAVPIEANPTFSFPLSEQQTALPIGTRVAVRISTELMDGRRVAGEEFYGVLAEPLGDPGTPLIPAGSPIYGRIDVIDVSTTGRVSSLHLSLTAVLHGGERVPLRSARYRVLTPLPRDLQLTFKTVERFPVPTAP